MNKIREAGRMLRRLKKLGPNFSNASKTLSVGSFQAGLAADADEGEAVLPQLRVFRREGGWKQVSAASRRALWG